MPEVVDVPFESMPEEQREYVANMRELVHRFGAMVMEVEDLVKENYDQRLATAAVLDALFTVIVDYGRIVFNYDRTDVKTLGAAFYSMTSLYLDVVKSREDWGALMPHYYLLKDREISRAKVQ